MAIRTSLSCPRSRPSKKPASISYAQAAAIPVNYLTAWQLLVVMGSLNHGETVNRLTKGKGVALITDPLGGNHW